MSKATLKVEGMSCGKCAARVEKAALALDGVTAVSASHEQDSATVEFEDGAVTTAQIADAITAAGYSASA
ncbi:heavy-metal-associated domain-containing protein [bacterium]|nr:heavy-metal-associated domain-containing protein [bacterium]